MLTRYTVQEISTCAICQNSENYTTLYVYICVLL